MNKKITSIVVSAGLLAGGTALTMLSPGLASAQSPDGASVTSEAEPTVVTSAGSDAANLSAKEDSSLEAASSDEPTSYNAEGDQGEYNHPPMGKRFAGLAEILGLEVDELKDALKSGQSLAEVAEANGMSVDELTEAMIAAQADNLATAVEDGKISQEQADKISAKFTENIDTIVNAQGAPGGPTGKRGHRVEQAQEMAEVLGIDVDALKEALKSGESLADIAEANGIDTQEVIDTIVSNMTERLDQAIADGKIDEDRVAEIASNIQEHATDIANGDARPGHPGERGGHGPRGDGGSELNAA